MKLIEYRIKYLLKERESSIEEYSNGGPEMQMLLAMVNMRISMELKFLAEILNELTKKPTDKDVDSYFPEDKSKYSKSYSNNMIVDIKRNAVKSFIKNKL